MYAVSDRETLINREQPNKEKKKKFLQQQGAKQHIGYPGSTAAIATNTARLSGPGTMT
jgi:hypothetical protein